MNAFWIATVIQNGGVLTTGILKGIREDGHSVEGTVGVDALGQRNDSGSEPSGINSRGVKRVVNNLTK
jgi:hypothetical protein